MTESGDTVLNAVYPWLNSTTIDRQLQADDRITSFLLITEQKFQSESVRSKFMSYRQM